MWTLNLYHAIRWECCCRRSTEVEWYRTGHGASLPDPFNSWIKKQPASLVLFVGYCSHKAYVGVFMLFEGVLMQLVGWMVTPDNHLDSLLCSYVSYSYDKAGLPQTHLNGP